MYILASDYDGTLNHGDKISQADRDAIARFRAAGNKFGVVSGRAMDMYDTLVDKKLDVDFVIVYNGATAMDGNGSVIFDSVVENTRYEDGTTLLHAVCARVGDAFDTWVSSIFVRDRKTFYTGVPAGNEKYAPIAETDKIEVFTHLNMQCRSDEEAARCTAMLRENFSDSLNPVQNGVCIDMPPKGIDKAVGILRYAALIGAEEDKIYTAGDNCNDIAMLKRFHGCAVANARPEVKAISEGVYDGIFAMIDKIMALDA